MKKQMLSQESVLQEFETEDFILKTQRQIAKDFAFSGIYFDSNFETEVLDYATITDQVQEKLTEVMQFGERQLLQLLYQIDIPQADFLNKIGTPDFLQKLSEMIIRREAYKIYLRRKFSN